jgi:[ribosomal protein S18]-alanine N-acetyltransferase
MIEIVTGDARDIASIMPVMAAAFDPNYGEAWTASQCLAVLTLPESQLHLAQSEGTVIGFALSRGVVDEEELLLIAVHPDWKRRGVATRLVQTTVSSSCAIGRRKLFIEVRSNNSAIDFYRQIGFERVGTRPSYYSGSDGQRYDAETMQLNIKVS